MKTYLTITYSTGRYEHSLSVLRPRHRSTPTVKGAARIVANELNRKGGFPDDTVKPSDISIHRIEEAVWCG